MIDRPRAIFGAGKGSILGSLGGEEGAGNGSMKLAESSVTEIPEAFDSLEVMRLFLRPVACPILICLVGILFVLVCETKVVGLKKQEQELVELLGVRFAVIVLQPWWNLLAANMVY